METALRASVLDWLAADPVLADAINLFAEEAPLDAIAPWLGIVTSASSDWSVKDRKGREVRLAIELNTRGDDAATTGALVSTIDRRIDAMPETQADFDIANSTFLRARAERRPNNVRAVLMEYRFRALETATTP